MFYEIDLLLEHQNRKFKQFRANRSFLLQESDELFHFHALLVNALKKVRTLINQIVIGQERDKKHPQKDAFFNIFSLVDQLHCSKSIDRKDPKQRKIYFSENQVFNLINFGQAYLPQAVALYNDFIEKRQKGIDRANKDTLALELDRSQNKNVNELFNQAQNEALVTLELSELFTQSYNPYLPQMHNNFNNLIGQKSISVKASSIALLFQKSNVRSI